MNLIIIRSNLKDGLGIVERSVGDGTGLPILKNILIRASSGKVLLSATNLEIGTTASVSSKIIEDGGITVPAATLRDIVSNLPSDRLTLETKGNTLQIKTDNYKANIQGLGAEEFPLIPKIKNTDGFLEIEEGVLREALEQVAVSAQFSDLRPELNSVLLGFSVDQLKLAATDSFRLSEKTVFGGQFKTNHESSFNSLIPLKTAQELIRILKDDGVLKISLDPNQILFQTDRFELISRLIDGNFPNYDAIVPKEFETQITVNKQELINAIRLAGVFSSKVNEIRIKTGDNKKTLELFSVDQTIGDNNYTMPAKTQGKSKEMSFNWRYLMDGLKAIQAEEVFWGINEENKPALLRSTKETSFFYVLMPILKT